MTELGYVEGQNIVYDVQSSGVDTEEYRAVPVTNVFGDPQGMLTAIMNLKFMWDLVDRLNVGEDGLAYVVDAQGDLLAFSDTARDCAPRTWPIFP